jgi:hypothetical protein
VPAAHTLFIIEKVTCPFFSVVNLASCPPISIIVSTCGSSWHAALAWAVISSNSISAFMILPMNFLPEPVVAVPKNFNSISYCFCMSSIVSSMVCTAIIGLPDVLVYKPTITFPVSSIIIAFVLVEPMSMPK